MESASSWPRVLLPAVMHLYWDQCWTGMDWRLSLWHCHPCSYESHGAYRSRVVVLRGIGKQLVRCSEEQSVVELLGPMGFDYNCWLGRDERCAKAVQLGKRSAIIGLRRHHARLKTEKSASRYLRYLHVGMFQTLHLTLNVSSRLLIDINIL